MEEQGQGRWRVKDVSYFLVLLYLNSPMFRRTELIGRGMSARLFGLKWVAPDIEAWHNIFPFHVLLMLWGYFALWMDVSANLGYYQLITLSALLINFFMNRRTRKTLFVFWISDLSLGKFPQKCVIPQYVILPNLCLSAVRQHILPSSDPAPAPLGWVKL